MTLLFFLLLGLWFCLRLYNNWKTVPPRPKVTQTLIGSHNLPVKRNRRPAAPMTGSALATRRSENILFFSVRL